MPKTAKPKTRPPVERDALLVEFLGRLQTCLVAKGLSRSELARRLDCPPSTISNWYERGHYPGPRHLVRIPLAIGCSAQYLLTGDGPMFPAKLPHGSADIVRQLENAGRLAQLQIINEAEQMWSEIRRRVQLRHGTIPKARGEKGVKVGGRA